MRGLLGKMLYYTSLYTVLPAALNGSERSRVIVRVNDEIILTKTVISTQKWRTPGGGKHKNESIQQCAVREVKEELGIELSAARLKKVSEIHESLRSSKYKLVYFVCNLTEKPAIRPRFSEMLDYGWFNINQLPEGCHSELINIVDKLKKQAK